MSIFWPSKLTMILDRYTYTAGETITWTLTLKSDTPIQTQWIGVNLRVERKNTNVSNTEIDQYRMLYDKNITLLPAWEYINEVIPFSYNIPQNIIPEEWGFLHKLGGIPAWVLLIINLLSTYSKLTKVLPVYNFTLTWFVDIPWAIDLRETTNIEILPMQRWNVNITNFKSIIPPEIQDAINKQNSNNTSPI